MARRRVRRAPYGAALALAAWAGENWTLLDGRCLLNGVDIEPFLDLPAARLVAMLHAMAIDSMQFAEEDKRMELINALDWPDLAEEREMQASTDQARAALGALGIDIDALQLAAFAAQPEPVPA